MSFGLYNSAMLLGLAGLALPLLVHLLSRRKHDVVNWGAMQFLELSRNTRRRLRLEEFLLMVLRMGMIGLLGVAMCRPWLSGGPASLLSARQSRDVVFVIDSSYSMDWEGKATTPHAAALQWALSYLDELRPGDTVALVDARDQVRGVIETPTGDFALARERLTGLPSPAGSADLLDAATQALRILSRGDNLSREVIVLTDGQARSWPVNDPGRWDVLDDLRDQSSIKPRLWVVDVMGPAADRTNFSLETLEPSRAATAVNLPIRVKTKLRNSGGKTPMQRKVYLEVDGQRLADATLQTPLLQPGGEFSVEFEHRFASIGSHLIGVVIDADNLPGDNRAEAAITVTDALPVLLVDGDPQLDPTRSETFFAQAALSATENKTPLVRARVVDAEHFAWPEPVAPGGPAGAHGPAATRTPAAPRVIVLANVPRFTPALADALTGFVTGGGGLLVAPGNKVDPRAYNSLFIGDGSGVLPAVLQSIQQVQAGDVLGVRIFDGSLASPLVTQFRREHDGGLTDSRFTNWWKIAPVEKSASPPVVAMKFDTGDPALLLRDYGRGRVALLAFPLDSDWSTLPAKSDFVPLLYELLFHLARGADPSRNVRIGDSLVLPVAADALVENHIVRGPAGIEAPPEASGDGPHPQLVFHDTRRPGVYTFTPVKSGNPQGAILHASLREQFVVNADRAESDLTPLDEKARQVLGQHDRVRFISSLGELQQQVSADGPKSEIWRFFIVALFGLLIFELSMTRRLVRGGHAVDDEPE